MTPTKRIMMTGISWSFALLFSFSAHAEKMDIETHGMVIEKLESVLQGQDDSAGVSRTGILIRLGDLYSERARLKAMKESEQGCNDKCKDSRNDRKTALSYYERALPQAPDKERESIILQMTHLYELTEQKAKAQTLYNRSIAEGSKRHTTAFLAQAETGLGELAYRDGKNQEAIKHFQKALSYKDCPKKGLVNYRMAWSQLNSGNQKAAVDTLVKILKSPELLARESSEGPQVDKSFAEDVSRDLATFLARGNVGNREIQLLRELSPAQAVADNLLYLGSETDRLGNKPAALTVNKMLLGLELTALQRLEIYVRIPQIELDLGHKEQAITEMDKASQFWKKNGCQINPQAGQSEEDCKTLQSRMRKMVTDWDRRTRKKYQDELLKAYVIYNDLFANDTEMQYWAGNVARNLKNSRQAIASYRKASILAAEELKKGGDRKKLNIIFEGSLLGEIEMAEILKDAGLRDAAYSHYINLNPHGDRIVEVRYQKAHVAFERKQFADAATGFHDVALLKDKRNATLRAQAADLAIDSLVELKDDERIELWANEFANAFPIKRNEFAKISRTASLNLVAKAAMDKQAESSEVKSALKRMQHINLAGATMAEKVSYFKTRLLLAEKEKNLEETNRASDQMLAIKGLSAQDRDYALSRKAWAAEMRLDFKQALKISKQMKFPELKEGERLLRLALLAELAGENAKSYYEQYLHRHSGKDTPMVMGKLIRQSRTPWADLKKNLSVLKRNPEVLASVVLDTLLKTKDHKQASEYANIRGVVATPAGQSLARLLFIANFQDLNSRLVRQRIPRSGDAQIQRAVAQRLEMIQTGEGMAQYAVNTQDWSLQILALSLLERENKRLHNDLLALPVPRGLKGAQRASYQQTVQRQAQGYLEKAKDLNLKLTEFWQNVKALDEALEVFEKVRPQVRSFAVTEMRLLADAAGPRAKWKLEKVIAQNGKKTAISDLLRARHRVQQNPFDVAAVQNLKLIEEQTGGSETMLVYLEARLDQLQTGGRK